jgi:hypothetical protein
MGLSDHSSIPEFHPGLELSLVLDHPTQAHLCCLRVKGIFIQNNAQKLAPADVQGLGLGRRQTEHLSGRTWDIAGQKDQRPGLKPYIHLHGPQFLYLQMVV